MFFLISNPSNGNDPLHSQMLVSSVVGRNLSTRAPQVKRSWITRKLSEIGNAFRFEQSNNLPRTGDCVFAKVANVANHTRLFTDDNRYSRLYKNDLIVGVVGSRYATDAYHATRIDPSSLHMLTNAGLLGTVSEQHKSLSSPTKLELLGYLIDENGARINIKNHFFKPCHEVPPNVNSVVVVGTGMNSGKTTSTARLGHALAQSGQTVAIIKLTGSASHRDVHEFMATGAIYAADFTDHGFPSTYLATEQEIETLYCRMMTDVAAYNPDVVLVEIADGVYQRETQFLLNSNVVKATSVGVVLTAACAASALSLDQAVKQSGWDPIAMTGLITNSPLFVNEFSQLCQTPVFNTGKRVSEIGNLIMSRVNARKLVSIS